MILVTGGTGLVGSHLLYHLTQNNVQVRAIYRSEQSLERVRNVFSYYTDQVDEFFSKIDWQQADITEVPAMIPLFVGVTQVYHCAAFISFVPSDYREMRKVNIYGTAILVNLAIDAGVKKFCYVSSIAAVGDDPKKTVADEDNEWAGNEKNHGYAITKYGGEMEVWRASQEGVDVVIVNPGVILGSGFWDSGSGSLFSQVHNGFSFYTKGTTGFVGVEDVVTSMIQLMKSDVKNERFILVAENKGFDDVLFTIADAFEKKRPSKLVKPWMSELFWRWEWLLSKVTGSKPRMSKHSAKSLHTKTEYSSAKIEKQIGFQFQNINEVIQKVCKDYLLLFL
jgi:nucleoside-diphosphate-sugar epimerase